MCVLEHFERSQERHHARVAHPAASFAEGSQQCVKESPCFTYVQAASLSPVQVQLRALCVTGRSTEVGQGQKQRERTPPLGKHGPGVHGLL